MAHAQTGQTFGRLAAGAALGFVAGLALPHARKAVMQAPSIAAGDWAEALKTEHRMVETMFETLLATSEDERVKREAGLAKIAYALTKHGIEEENVIYPALAEGGRAVEAKALAEDHAQIKTLIYELRRLPASDAAWILRARTLQQLVERHAREEEDKVFPAFRAELTTEENARLARMLNWEGFKVA